MRGSHPAQAPAPAEVVVALRADDDGAQRGRVGEVLPAVARLLGGGAVGHGLHAVIVAIVGGCANGLRPLVLVAVAGGERRGADPAHHDRGLGLCAHV